MRVCFGDPDASDARVVVEGLVAAESGRSREEPAVSRSFDFILPNPLNAEPRFEADFLSGEDCLPYGCILWRRRFRTVPNRFRGFELCFASGTVA